MQNGTKITRCKLSTRLTMLVGGVIALSAASSLLTGCGGGGGGGIAEPTPVSVPVLPPLAVITPQTPTEAATNFQTQFGIPTVVGAVIGTPITNVAQTLQQALTLDTFIVPTYTTASNSEAVSNGAASLAARVSGVTLQTARQAGLTQAELNAIIQILLTAKETIVLAGPGNNQPLSMVPIVRVGDTLRVITFTYHGQQYPTVVFVHPDGKIGYNSVLFAQPGTSEQRQLPNNQDEANRLPNGGSTVESVITNRNPYDGHFHYRFVLSAQAAFNRLTGLATVSHPKAAVDILGPFVGNSVPTGPTITKVAASVEVRASHAPSQLLQSRATFQFKYARHLVWEIKELIRLLLRNKTVTGSTGGSG